MASKNEKIIVGIGAAVVLIYLLGKGKGGSPGGGEQEELNAVITDLTVTGG